jgi:hypothetical protein
MRIDRGPWRVCFIEGGKTLGFSLVTVNFQLISFRFSLKRGRRNTALYSIGTPEWTRPGLAEGRGHD